MVVRVGVVGYGHLGRYLSSKIQADEDLQLAFVWNRTKGHLSELDPSLVLDDITDFRKFSPHLVVEVAHPLITRQYGEMFVKSCDYMVGSPTALCDEELLNRLKTSATNNGVYVPSGAFWGGEDIRKMDEAKKIRSLSVEMRKHPSSLKVDGYLKDLNDLVRDEPVTLFRGPVAEVCPLAPNNTNTMAIAALAAPSLGFRGVQGCLVSDPKLQNYHIVEIEASGFPNEDGSCFHVHTIRRNPAEKGQVTGQATYAAYFRSLKRAGGKGPGIHLC